MTWSGIKLLTPAVLSMALIATPPVIPAFAAGGGGGGGGGGGDPQSAMPPPETKPPAKRTTQKGKKKPDKQSSLDDPAFAAGYRAAYATIYQRNDYAAAIEQTLEAYAAILKTLSNWLSDADPARHLEGPLIQPVFRVR